MKKFTSVVVLFLAVFLLVGCSLKKEPIGGANTSYPKQDIGEIYTDELVEIINAKYTLEPKALNHGTYISYSNEYLMAFPSCQIYSFYSNKEFVYPEGDTITSCFVEDLQYVRAKSATKHYIYHYLTTELLYTLEISADYQYTFDEDMIVVRKYDGNLDEFVEQKRYYFVDYQPVTDIQEDDPDPLDFSKNAWLMKIHEYSFLEDANDITIFKDNKFYAHYYYEASHLRHFFLENGNFLTMHLFEVADGEPYDYTQYGVNYKLMYYYYNLAKKEAKLVNLPIYIQGIHRKTEYDPMGIPAMIFFNSIDPNTKTLDNKTRSGSINNDLKIKEIIFEFGEYEDIIPVEGNQFVVMSKLGVFLVNGKNEIINSFLFDDYNFDIKIYKNATALVYSEYVDGPAYLYNLKDSKLLEEGYTYIGEVNENQVLLKKDSDYYYFNGAFTKLKGPATPTYNAPCFSVQTHEGYEFYYQDGTFLFKASNENIDVITHTAEDYRVRVFTYKDLEDNNKHFVLKIIGTEGHYT